MQCNGKPHTHVLHYTGVAGEVLTRCGRGCGCSTLRLHDVLEFFVSYMYQSRTLSCETRESYLTIHTTGVNNVQCDECRCYSRGILTQTLHTTPLVFVFVTVKAQGECVVCRKYCLYTKTLYDASSSFVTTSNIHQLPDFTVNKSGV